MNRYVVTEDMLSKWLQEELGSRIDSEPMNRRAWRRQATKTWKTIQSKAIPGWATHFARACPRTLDELVFDSSEEIPK